MIYDFTNGNGSTLAIDMREVIAINHYSKKDHLALLMLYGGRDIPVMLDKALPPLEAHDDLDALFKQVKDTR